MCDFGYLFDCLDYFFFDEVVVLGKVGVVGDLYFYDGVVGGVVVGVDLNLVYEVG